MLLWGRHLLHPRDMTEDLDCALLAPDIPDAVAAEELARDVAQDLRDLGFSRGDDWRESRKGRFSYSHAVDEVAVEFLCGDVSFGRSSGREPAWQLATMPDGPPHFYAARVPWLDLVAEWVPVRAHCDPDTFHPRIPDLAGLVVLKIRAVADKSRRVEEERDPERLELEKLRLRRHATDCSLLFDWIDGRGEFDRLARLSREHGEIRSTARTAARWIFGRPELAEELHLAPVERALARLVPAGA